MNNVVYSIEDIKIILYDIFKETSVQKAVLFGSYAKNKQTNVSDIDILIDSHGELKGLRFYALLDLIKEKFDKEVDIIEKSEIEKNSEIEKEIQETGIIIYEK